MINPTANVTVHTIDAGLDKISIATVNENLLVVELIEVLKEKIEQYVPKRVIGQLLTIR